MPLDRLDKLLSEESVRIGSWFAERWRGLSPLPYFSCDIRHSIHKIGVVDTNLFPGGFNNLCNTFTRDTAIALDRYFTEYFPGARNILIFGEAHTRNKFYLLNLARLKELIEATGRECRITMPLNNFPEPRLAIPLTDDRRLILERVENRNGALVVDGFVPDIVLSNNDFSAGVPLLLRDVTIPIIPSPDLGWHKRRKSSHFRILAEILAEFAADFDFDPWTLGPITEVVENVTAANLASLARTVDDVIGRVRQKYEQYKINETPAVFVKNDAGTYGLGLVTVSSGEELLVLNRKRREKMFSAKGGHEPNAFLVQEGIPTLDTYSGFPIEPVIYGVGKEAVGGFFRIHEEKTPFESLNAPGMSFSCLCLHKLDEPHETYFLNCRDKALLVKGARFIARFAALAAGREARAGLFPW